MQTEFGKSSWKIGKGAMVVARGTKSRTLYTTTGCMNISTVAESASNSSLWHNRLGHMSVERIKILAVEGVLEGLKSVDTSPCENCIMSKQKRVSFRKTTRELKKGSGTMKQVGLRLSCRTIHRVMLQILNKLLRLTWNK